MMKPLLILLICLLGLGPTSAFACCAKWFPQILSDNANTVCHAWFNGTQIRDVKGCQWAMTGSVPQTPIDTVSFGAGPFSSSPQAHYEVENVLNFDADHSFTVIAVYRVNRSTSDQFLVDNIGTPAERGWSIKTNTDTVSFQSCAGSSCSSVDVTYGQPPSGQYNVVVVGRSKTQLLVSTAGSLSTSAVVYAESSPKKTRLGAMAGVLFGQDYPFLGTLYEFRVDAVAPSTTYFTTEAVAAYRVLGKKIISLLGDSNTLYYASRCPSRWDTTAYIANDGKGGSTSTSTLSRLTGAMARGTTDIVVMAGTNDRATLTKEQTWTNLLSIYETAKAAGLRVWPLTIPPCGGHATCNPWETSRLWINDQIKAWGVANSRHVTDMDIEWGNGASPVGLSAICESGDHIHATLACQLSLCDTLGGIVP